MTPEIKELDRNKKREYTKNRRSEKYCSMQQLYEDKVKVAKQNYYINIVQDLKAGNPGQWYSKLKRMSNMDNTQNSDIIVEQLDGLSKQQQVEEIAEAFSTISNLYETVKYENLIFNTSPTKPTELSEVFPHEIFEILDQMKTNKSTVKGDIPAKILKEFAEELRRRRAAEISINQERLQRLSQPPS